MIRTRHRLDFCNHCEVHMLRCATCGNNCCSGGSGTVNGEKCPDCSDAYAVQDAYYADPDAVVFEVA